MRRSFMSRAMFAIGIAVVIISPSLFAQQDTVRPAAWTKAEALNQLRLAPQDPFLQFVVVQMCLRDGDFAEARAYLPPALSARDIGGQRNRQIDLYRIFSGSLAVQETLQLDALAGPLDAMADMGGRPGTAGPSTQFSPRPIPGRQPNVFNREPGGFQEKQREPKGQVPVSQLQGPTVQPRDRRAA